MNVPKLTAVGLAVLLLTSSVAGVVMATPDQTTGTDSTTAPDQPTDGDRVAELTWYLDMFDLSGAQVDAIVAEAKRMHEAGATGAEIRRMVVDSLRDYGVSDREIHEKNRLRHLYGLKTHYDLTDAQLDELTTMVQTMYDDGEAVAEIKHAIVWQLQDYGVDTTDLEDRIWQARYDRLLRQYDLTESEAQLIVDDARALFEEGATWDEIQDSVRSDLREFDAKRADRAHWHDKLQFVKKVHDLAHTYGLSGEEVRDVATTARDMKADGASDAEIRDAVREMVHDYATDDGHDRLERFAKHLKTNYPLTNEEVRDIVQTVKRMHADGANREEIKRVVHAKVKHYTADDRREHAVKNLATHLKQHFPLSDAEVRDIVSMAVELRQNGATNEEVEQAVREKVKHYTADDRRKAVTKRIAHHLHAEYDLTREEVRMVLSEARELHEDGASWAELREYIDERAEELSGSHGGSDTPPTDRPADSARTVALV
ncbi:hypothetical protein [Haloarchaeobius sp. TZWWS8]|uniref:hypothetical protein n=1 Tax=Haloarchaeobius sp. TZWWS8 TaxID=3446121 RepID=UPI003EB86A62